jgi:prepilin-type N-terminal cleavage/methylation domain-containing protein
MKEHGVSLVEMMSVLLILGIISGVIISRVASVDEMELAAKVNSIRNHIRYTQIMAMKRNDMTWGIKCGGTHYWVFKATTPTDPTDWNTIIPNDTNNMVYLPGHENKQIPMPEMEAFTLYFDKFGIPYEYDATSTSKIVARDSELTIQIGDDANAKTLTVTEETGFVE